MNFEPISRVITALTTALLLACNANAQTSGNQLRASITVSSDLVQNGQLQTNDDPALQLSVDYEHRSGFFAGGSHTNVEYLVDERLASSRDSQTTAYVGYSWRREQWQTNVTLSHYFYPGFEREYDYTQFSAGASYRDRYFVSVAYSNDYLDRWDQTYLVSTGIALPWIQNLEFSASAGRLSYEGNFAASFSYWNIGLSRPFGRFGLDLRYHDNSFDRNNLAGNLTHDQWVVSTTWSLLPLPRSRGMR